jgi:hypothetical protein
MVQESRSLDSLSSDAIGLAARKLARTRSDLHGARIAAADLEHWHPEERAAPIHTGRPPSSSDRARCAAPSTMRRRGGLADGRATWSDPPARPRQVDTEGGGAGSTSDEEDEGGLDAAAAEQPALERPAVAGSLLVRLCPELLLLNEEERSFVLVQRALVVLDQFVGGISSIAGTEHLIALCGGSMEAMARHNAALGSAMSLLRAFLAPMMTALSDAHGRVRPLLVGRGGWLAWLLLSPRVGSLPARFAAAVVSLGVLMAGMGTVLASASSDLIAFKPALAAQIAAQARPRARNAPTPGPERLAELVTPPSPQPPAPWRAGLSGRGGQNGVWANLGSMASLVVGAAVKARFGSAATFNASALLCALSLGLVLRISETLHRDDRKAFSLAHANPFANLRLCPRPRPAAATRRAVSIANRFRMPCLYMGAEGASRSLSSGCRRGQSSSTAVASVRSPRQPPSSAWPPPSVASSGPTRRALRPAPPQF